LGDKNVRSQGCEGKILKEKIREKRKEGEGGQGEKMLSFIWQKLRPFQENDGAGKDTAKMIKGRNCHPRENGKEIGEHNKALGVMLDSLYD